VLERARASRRAERAAKPAAEVARPAPRPSAAATQKAVDKLDRRMEDIRGKIEILDLALSDPAIYSEEPKKAGDFTKLRARLANELEELENQWLEAQMG
jgi:ATP-binding cassette subfamily F protein uup